MLTRPVRGQTLESLVEDYLAHAWAPTMEGIDRETFVILPHPQVIDYMRKKTENYDRWIGGMAKIQAKLRESNAKE